MKIKKILRKKEKVLYINYDTLCINLIFSCVIFDAVLFISSDIECSFHELIER